MNLSHKTDLFVLHHFNRQSLYSNQITNQQKIKDHGKRKQAMTTRRKDSKIAYSLYVSWRINYRSRR